METICSAKSFNLSSKRHLEFPIVPYTCFAYYCIPFSASARARPGLSWNLKEETTALDLDLDPACLPQPSSLRCKDKGETGEVA